MKKIIRKIQYRLLPRHISEALAGVNSEPTRWDIAAVQLDQHHSQVETHRYPQYLYGLLCAARTAKAVGSDRFTAIEFGVAGGNGLLAMESHAGLVEKLWQVNIEVVGFDMASGLPPRDEPRDCPFAFSGGAGGEFAMDETTLRSRLRRAELLLGDIAGTAANFMQDKHAPIGFVSNDFDLYTSTRDSLKLFTADSRLCLPRVHMYFDDIIGYPYTTQNAEFAAIDEFNRLQEQRKIGLYYGLKYCLGPRYRFAQWAEKIFVLELFDHEQFNMAEETDMPDLVLR